MGEGPKNSGQTSLSSIFQSHIGKISDHLQTDQRNSFAFSWIEFRSCSLSGNQQTSRHKQATTGAGKHEEPPTLANASVATSDMSVSPQAMRGCTRDASALVTEVRFAECSDCSDCLSLADAECMESLNSQFDLLGRLIDATKVRHLAISNNIANVNTPNYRRIDVKFEEQLAKEMSSHSNDGHNPPISARPEIVVASGLNSRADGNNVDIDHEIGQLNKNAMMQQTYVQLLSTYLDQMRMAINGQ